VSVPARDVTFLLGHVNLTLKWNLGVVQIDTLSALATMYVPVGPVRAVVDGLAVNPTADVVSMAFVGLSDTPVSGDWKAASWDQAPIQGDYIIQCLVGPSGGVTTLTPGQYAVWVKIVDNPETVIAQVLGGLQVV
jgi:hypothetical protein